MADKNEPEKKITPMRTAQMALRAQKSDITKSAKDLVWPMEGPLLGWLSIFFVITLLLECTPLLGVSTGFYGFFLGGKALTPEGLEALGLHLAVLLSLVPLVVAAAQKTVLGKKMSYFSAFGEGALWKTFAALLVADALFLVILSDLGRMPRFAETGVIILFVGLCQLFIRLSVGGTSTLKQEGQRYMWGLGFSLLFGLIFALTWLFFVVMMTAPVLAPMQQSVAAMNPLGVFGPPVLSALITLIKAYVGVFCVGGLSRVYMILRDMQEKRATYS